MHEEQFISEPITPVAGAFDTSLMRQGLASLPSAFTWRGKRYEIIEVLEHTKQSSREGGFACGELYLRRQMFRVRLDTGEEAQIYFERQPRAGATRKTAKSRWFLYTLASGEA